MGDINVSTIGVYDNGLNPPSDNLRYGIGIQFNQSLFKKENSSVNLGISAQGYIPLKGKAALDIDFKQKVSPNFNIGAGLEGTYSIQKTKDNVNQLTLDRRDNLGFSGPIDFAEPYNITIIDPEDPVVYVASGIEKPPEVGDVIDEVKISEKTLTAPNQCATIAAKTFVEYQPNEKVSFTAGVKLGQKYILGGKVSTDETDYKSTITSSKYVGSWVDYDAGFSEFTFDNYRVSSSIVESHFSSSVKNRDSQFKAGVFGEANYKVNDSFKIGAFGDTFHKEAGIKATFTF